MTPDEPRLGPSPLEAHLRDIFGLMAWEEYVHAVFPWPKENDAREEEAEGFRTPDTG